MKPVARPSPNQDARSSPIDMLVLHYTGMRTAEAALTRLCDPAAKVSAHYTIDRDGTIYAHVPEERRAWHAGISYWAGARDINARSIGIELVNPGHEFGYIPFTDDQLGALIELSRGILARHTIPPRRVLGHSDVAPARKTDPGELFPWEKLAAEGIGVWPALAVPIDDSDERLAGELAAYGYGLSPEVNIPLATVIAAFQRHFRPARIDGIADDETRRIATALAQPAWR